MKDKHKNLYMSIAQSAAMASYAVKLKVGAVAVKDHRILSIGYNGTPPGRDNACEFKHHDLSRDMNGNYFPGSEKEYPLEDEFGRYKLETKREVVHAEMNAIFKMARDGQSALGADIFITHAPCFECAKAILSVGFKKVWFRDSYRDSSGVTLLTEHNVEVEQYEEPGA